MYVNQLVFWHNISCDNLQIYQFSRTLKIPYLEKHPWHSQVEAFWAATISAMLFGAAAAAAAGGLESVVSFLGLDTAFFTASLKTVSNLSTCSSVFILIQKLSALASPSAKSWWVAQIRALAFPEHKLKSCYVVQILKL